MLTHCRAVKLVIALPLFLTGANPSGTLVCFPPFTPMTTLGRMPMPATGLSWLYSIPGRAHLSTVPTLSVPSQTVQLPIRMVKEAVNPHLRKNTKGMAVRKIRRRKHPKFRKVQLQKNQKLLLPATSKQRQRKSGHLFV